MSLKFFALMLVLSTRAFCQDALSLSTQYHAWANETNFVDETALVDTSLASWLQGSFAGRIAESKNDFEQFDYSAEVALPFLSLFSLHTRLSQMNFLNDSTSRTDLLFALEIEGNPFHGFTLFGDYGWYERFVSIDKAVIAPILFHNSYREHDMAARVGAKISLTDSLSLMAQVSTYEELEVYNLHNPFAGLKLWYQPSKSQWQFFLESRYRVLLGFGRLDDFVVGLGAVSML